MSAITLRACGAGDALELRRLAELDGAAPLTGEVLAAEQHGELRAAIALAGRRVIADPFHPTADLVELLETRAAQIHARRDPPRVRVRARLRAIRGHSVSTDGGAVAGSPS